MARLFLQHLAIYINENYLPHGLHFFPKVGLTSIQNVLKPSKIAQDCEDFDQITKFRSNLVTLNASQRPSR